MKSKLNVNKSMAIKFPRLYRSKKGGRVVMFFSSKSGVVVFAGSRSEPVGYYCEDWINCDHSECWEPLPKGSTVTLEQE